MSLLTFTKDRWSIYIMQADRFGNVRFFCMMGQYWFNINDALEISDSNFFSFSPLYKVECTLGGDCDMSYLINKNNQKERALWPGLYGSFQFLKIKHEDRSRLIKAFNHLKTLAHDPFKE